MKCFTAILALASVSSTMSVNVAGYLRRNYDGGASTASVAISDAEEPKQAGSYEATPVFAEKKKEKDEADKAQKKLWYWTEIEACEECKKLREEIENATSEFKKKKAKKYFKLAAAAAFRAASHESEKGKELWENFQEKYGADKANELADKWLAKHASSYDEKAFDDIDFAAKKGKKDDDDPQIFICVFYEAQENLRASTSSVAISEEEEPKQADRYEPTSVFAEKKKEKDEAKEAQQKLWYWTEKEACDECLEFKKQIENATSELGKKKAKKYYEQAAAATLRAASHFAGKGQELWEKFQEKYGAEKANRLADEWLAKHASSYEKAFDDIDFAAKDLPEPVGLPSLDIIKCYRRK